MIKQEVTIIEVEWEGPFDYKSARTNSSSIETDYGLYQIYGTHAIFGADSLLYIGKAENQKISNRLFQHQGWLSKEFGKTEIYIGRIGGVTEPIGENEWSTEIDFSERLLIYNCAPPYNTSCLTDFGNIKDTLVLNYGQRHRLPFVVSTLSRDAEYFNSGLWKKYIYKS
jgi:hypothetical protein